MARVGIQAHLCRRVIGALPFSNGLSMSIVGVGVSRGPPK